MEIALIIMGSVFAAAAVAVLVVFVVKKAKSRKKVEVEPVPEVPAFVEERPVFVIPIEQLPEGYLLDESQLIEIKNTAVLSRISKLLPGFAKVGNASAKAVQASQASGEVLYRAIIPAGESLAASGAVPNAVRVGAEGIKGQANLIALGSQSGALAISSAVTAAMGVVALVVGQYYMTKIHKELDVLHGDISRISEFLDNEYRSRVFSLFSHIKRIAEFEAEILENQELRLSKIAQLDRLEEECTQLLGQANLSLAGYANKHDLGFGDYEKELKEAHNWYQYQKPLNEALAKIADLRYALHLGAVSKEQCQSLLLGFWQQTQESRQRIAAWHQEITKKRNIDLSTSRRKRDGFDGVLHFLPGLFKKEHQFKLLNEETKKLIEEQIKDEAQGDGEQVESELYLQDVELIAKGEKVYYLPKRKMADAAPPETDLSQTEPEQGAEGEIAPQETAEPLADNCD